MTDQPTVSTPNTSTTPVISTKLTYTSPGYALTKADLISIGKGLLVAIGGAALTYLTAVVGKTNFTITYGGMMLNFTPVVYVLWSGVVNGARKVLDGVTPQE